jgi:hypothetical protein
MTQELVANRVSFDEDDDMAVFAFCGEEDKSAKYLMLQYPLQTDEQDRRLGLDGLYIERNAQAFGYYRGVQSLRRIGDRIEIDLSAEGKRRLKSEADSHCSCVLELYNRPRTCRLAELSDGEHDVQFQ